MDQGAAMNLQSGFKLLLASAAAACFVLPAHASNGQSSHGGWVSEASEHAPGRLDRDDSGKLDRDDSVKVVSSVKAPEMDPTSAISALTLLVGGLAVIRGRKSVELRSA
jgi:hypothetical protein